MFHTDEPLERQTRLDRHLSTLGKTDVVHIVFDLLHQSGGFKILGYLAADVETVHTDIHAGYFCDSAVFIEDVDYFKIVCLTEHIVVLIVRRCHFQTAGAEF